jgi:hypothetical protein
MSYETGLWNPILYAIYHKKLEVVKTLVEDFSVNI